MKSLDVRIVSSTDDTIALIRPRSISSRLYRESIKKRNSAKSFVNFQNFASSARRNRTRYLGRVAPLRDAGAHVSAISRATRRASHGSALRDAEEGTRTRASKRGARHIRRMSHCARARALAYVVGARRSLALTSWPRNLSLRPALTKSSARAATRETRTSIDSHGWAYFALS